MLYFTSDNHFGHENAIKYCDRPFSSVEEMNDVMIRYWNETVSPEDEIYHLGDFSLAASQVTIVTPILNGIKYLVPGNHDLCHTYHPRSHKPESHAKRIKQYQEAGWIVLPEQTSLSIPAVGEVDLCHHPYSDKDLEYDKYANWRPEDKGNWLLCGHMHHKWKIKEKMINVGVDVWNFSPVPRTEIIKVIHREENTQPSKKMK